MRGTTKEDDDYHINIFVVYNTVIVFHKESCF